MTPDALFAEVQSFIEESRALLRKGAMMELAGLDDQVKKLCVSATRLSQEERRAYADRLQALLDELTALGDEMVKSRDAVGEKLRNIDTHKKAHKAYRVVEASVGKKEEE